MPLSYMIPMGNLDRKVVVFIDGIAFVHLIGALAAIIFCMWDSCCRSKKSIYNSQQSELSAKI